MEKHTHVSIDYYAYASGLKEWNVTYKVLLAISALLLVVAADSVPLSVMTALFMGGVSCILGKVKARDYIRLLFIPAAFILTGGLAILIQFGTGTDSIFSVPVFSSNLYVTRESLYRSLGVSLKAFGAVSCMYLLTLSTPMGEIIGVFRRLHVPNLVLELMHFIYRYIFVLLDINHRQKDAVRSRLGYQDGRTAIRVFGAEMANLLIMSMSRAQDYYDALESRGYDGSCLFWEEQRKLPAGAVFIGLLYAALSGWMLLL